MGLLLGAGAIVSFSEVIRWINARENFVLSQAATAIDKRADIRKQLQQFYISGGTFIDADLPNNISDENFKAYEGAANQWINNTAKLDRRAPRASGKS